jgi:hypothetical protein
MKIRAPKEVRDLLSAHWERNKDNKVEEVWPVGNGTVFLICYSYGECHII